mmetsp:Transcript_32199/g.83524  ORF Transcript_32199/g.83524 Transcript_32199/m.83524 type:complete len:225 (-) Transcript_32199:873-1547(-)
MHAAHLMQRVGKRYKQGSNHSADHSSTRRQTSRRTDLELVRGHEPQPHGQQGAEVLETRKGGRDAVPAAGHDGGRYGGGEEGVGHRGDTVHGQAAQGGIPLPDGHHREKQENRPAHGAHISSCHSHHMDRPVRHSIVSVPHKHRRQQLHRRRQHQAVQGAAGHHPQARGVVELGKHHRGPPGRYGPVEKRVVVQQPSRTVPRAGNQQRTHAVADVGADHHLHER